MDYVTDETFRNIKAEKLGQAQYEGCAFINCNFAGADLTGFRFIESEFQECDLSNAIINNSFLQNVNFRRSKLLGLQFENCNDFGFAIHLFDSQLDHASFYQVRLSRSSFEHCKMHGVDFTRADLSNATVRYCDLKNAIFENTNLEMTDFSNSTQYSIDPELNRLKGAIFSLPDIVGLLDKYGVRIK